MPAEGVAGVWLLTTSSKFQLALSINFLGLLTIWLCTAALSVRLHEKLNGGFDEKLIRRLVASNWPRTLLWTGRGALLLFLFGDLIYC